MPSSTWSGHLTFGLISMPVRLFSGARSNGISFNMLHRTDKSRLKQQYVCLADGHVVERADIVKGYEYRKGEYIMIEPEEIEQIRIPSKHTIEVTQFVDEGELDPEFYEKPYFVVPENDVQAEAFAVVRKALQTTKKIALGKIAFSGREHLVAVSAGTDDKLPGMMAYTMRYAEELRDPKEFFEDIKKVAVDEDQLSLAKELIKRKASKFDPEKFKDQYEAALREMIEAKMKHVPLPKDEPAQSSGKVINLMDALRKSVQSDEAPAGKKKAPARATAEAAQKGIELVKPAKAHKSRKSA